MLRPRLRLLIALLIALPLGACSNDAAGPAGTKVPDASTPDGRDRDAAPADAAPVDGFAGDGAAGGLGAFAARGSFSVGTLDVTLTDASRPTPSNGDYPGAATRTLPVRVWYPATEDGADVAVAPGGPFPVVAYAHGFLSSADEAADLKEHLASHGYVVVAPTFPLSSGPAPGGPTFADIAHQPGDLAFAVEALAGGEGGALSGSLDRARQAVVGLSLGGATVLIAAFHPTLHLDVSAAVAFAPASCFFGPGLFVHETPAVLVSGTADMLVPTASVERVRAFMPGAPPLVSLVGGTHVGFTGVEIPDAGNSDDLGCSAVQGAIGAAGPTGIAGNLAADLAPGTDGTAVDVNGCGGADGAPQVCAERFTQTMHVARQLELARAITLAHLDRQLRGEASAAAFLTGALLAQPDVTVASPR